MAPDSKTQSSKSQISAMNEVTQQAFTELKKEVGEMKTTLDKLYFALIGNPLAQDGGIVKRVIEAEADLKVMQEKMVSMEKKNIKAATYVYILWGAGGCIVATIFAYIAQLFFSHIK